MKRTEKNKSKLQVIVIHGGETFDTYEQYLASLETMEVSLDKDKKKGWKQTLDKKLGKGFEVFQLDMPNKLNAKYTEWKILFEKYIPLFNEEIILIGNSLGGIFLSKYLSENIYPKKIRAVFLLAAPYDAPNGTQHLADFILPKSLKKFQDQVRDIFIYHSKDDPVVPFSDLEKYAKAIPKAHVRIFEDKQHFSRVNVPELIENIKNLS